MAAKEKHRRLTLEALTDVDAGRKSLPYHRVCATQGETFDELLSNIYEAVEGCLSVDIQTECWPKNCP